MIEKASGGGFDVTCDFCAVNYEQMSDDDFRSVVAAARRKGWKVFRHRGEWNHKCPECAGPSGVDQFTDDDF